jgi:hypothetical protein
MAPRQGINAACCFILHPRHDVTVQVHGDSDVGVAKPFLHDFGVYVCDQQMRRM